MKLVRLSRNSAKTWRERKKDEEIERMNEWKKERRKGSIDASKKGREGRKERQKNERR